MIYLATKTMDAIDAAILADGGNSYRQWLGKVLPHIGDAYRADDDGNRSHLGASVVGDECNRKIWYGFRWAYKSNFPARILRLFNRGHLEEGRLIAALLMIGVQVRQQDQNGKQYRISAAGGHFGGSGDGMLLGLPDLQPGQICLFEAKTHGEKSFFELAGKDWEKYRDGLVPFSGKGVREAKPEHYVQMTVYMRKFGLGCALYAAVNKNTDSIYMELIGTNPEFADFYIERGTQLIFTQTPPGKINNSPGYWGCRFCDAKPICHGGEEVLRNCRTCRYSRPEQDGEWYCLNAASEVPSDAPLSKETQRTGCSHYEPIEGL